MENKITFWRKECEKLKNILITRTFSKYKKKGFIKEKVDKFNYIDRCVGKTP